MPTAATQARSCGTIPFAFPTVPAEPALRHDRDSASAVDHVAGGRAKQSPLAGQDDRRALPEPDTRGHEAVPGSFVCASMKAGPGPCVRSHLLVARSTTRIPAALGASPIEGAGSLQSARSQTVICAWRMLVVVQEQPRHPAQSGNEDRLSPSRREFCLVASSARSIFTCGCQPSSTSALRIVGFRSPRGAAACRSPRYPG
jgi:hypothetical protein